MIKSEKLIKQFITDIDSSIQENYLKIKDVWSLTYNSLELDPLRDEICKCIMCNLNQAAITLTNHLLETSLKKSLILKFSILNRKEEVDFKDMFKEGIYKYDSKNLYSTINLAAKEKLIKEEEKNVLLKFKDEFRNPYSHAESSKIFANYSLSGRIISTKNSGEDLLESIFNEDMEDIPVKTILPVQGIGQVFIAKEKAIPYFIEVDKIIRAMLNRLNDKN